MTTAVSAPPAIATTSEPIEPVRGASLGDRLVARALGLGAAFLRALPDTVVYRAAHLVGAGLYLAMPARRRLVRANLERVSTWLDSQGMATPRVGAAVRDPRRLDRLVRDAFGHWVRTYAESAMAVRYDRDTLHERVRIDTLDATRAALAPLTPGEPGRIYVGFHLGSVELAALYAARESGLPIAGPMETVSNPALQAYFERTRGALGIGILPIRDAASEMRRRLERGEGIALVADRVVAGTGSRVELFGAPTRLPAGPSVLAAESNASVFVLAVRRVGWGRWAARVETLELPAGSRRERTRAGLEAEARILERFVAEAPEQWWTLFFPIWDDIS